MQRVRIGLTGLAFVFLAVVLAAIFTSQSRDELPITPNLIEQQQRGGAPAAPAAARPPASRPSRWPSSAWPRAANSNEPPRRRRAAAPPPRAGGNERSVSRRWVHSPTYPQRLPAPEVAKAARTGQEQTL